MSIPDLPSFWPVTKMIRAPEEYTPVEYTNVYPPLVKLSSGELVVGQLLEIDGGHSVKVWGNSDHPNMALLPEDIHKQVKALYKKSNQLMFLRMTSVGSTIDLIDSAYDAWGKYWRYK